MNRPPPTAATAGKAPPQSTAPSQVVMATYARADLVFERGEGCWLMTEQGDRYLDFASGVAVNVLGHAHPTLVNVLTEQAARLWHTSNLYRVAGQESVATKLCSATFADQVFFCNSGAEACEGAIKLARRYHYANGRPERFRIVTFEGAFHGRTLATIAAAGNPRYLEGFGPPVPGFDHVPLHDLAALQAAIGPETAAVMIEPVQGEGGVRVVDHEFLRQIRTLCDRHGLLMILDEVQTGIGRTGKLFAYQHTGVEPDIMAIAKGIGGGFPVGAVLATAAAGSALSAGTHGSTFGGNPLAMAVAGAVLDVVMAPGFLEGVSQKSLRLNQALARVKHEHPTAIEEIRGMGLLSGIRLGAPVADVVAACRRERLLVVGAGENVARFLPPLNVSDHEIVDAADRLSKALGGLPGSK